MSRPAEAEEECDRKTILKEGIADSEREAAEPGGLTLICGLFKNRAINLFRTVNRGIHSCPICSARKLRRICGIPLLLEFTLKFRPAKEAGT